MGKWAKHNFAGSWNDGEMSREFQEKIARDDINLPGHGVVSDSAFPVKDNLFSRIMTPLKEGDEMRAPENVRYAMLTMSAAITSVRQAAEWGMDAVGKVYRILQRKLPYNPIIRGRRLTILMLLYNYRVRTTGISQIRSYFMPAVNDI